jgi:hypothetical protein
VLIPGKEKDRSMSLQGMAVMGMAIVPFNPGR